MIFLSLLKSFEAFGAFGALILNHFRAFEVKMLQGLDQAGPSEQVPTQPAIQHVLQRIPSSQVVEVAQFV